MATGYHDFTAGETLTAANLEDYCVKQSVMRFASAAARNSALAAVLEEGMCAYLLDSNTLSVYSGAAWSTVGPVHGAWTGYTPTLTQSGAVTKTVTYAAFQRIGRTVSGTVELAVTGTGSASNKVTVSLPITARGSNGNTIVGVGHLYDATGPNRYRFVAALDSATTVSFYDTSSVAEVLLGASGNFTAALASGDVVSVQFSYEAAADA